MRTAGTGTLRAGVDLGRDKELSGRGGAWGHTSAITPTYVPQYLLLPTYSGMGCQRAKRLFTLLMSQVLYERTAARNGPVGETVSSNSKIRWS